MLVCLYVCDLGWILILSNPHPPPLLTSKARDVSIHLHTMSWQGWWQQSRGRLTRVINNKNVHNTAANFLSSLQLLNGCYLNLVYTYILIVLLPLATQGQWQGTGQGQGRGGGEGAFRDCCHSRSLGHSLNLGWKLSPEFPTPHCFDISKKNLQIITRQHVTKVSGMRNMLPIFERAKTDTDKHDDKDTEFKKKHLL